MTYWNDGREPRLLEHLRSLPETERNSPSTVLVSIDKWANQGKETFLMNIGDQKGEIVSKVIAAEKPKIMAELGGYVAYSAILFASEMLKHHSEEDRKAGKVKFYSLELSEEFAGIMKEIIKMAGLSDVIEILIGISSETLRKLKEEHKIEKLDMLFIDHFEQYYLPDLRIAESLGLVQPGTTVVADNIISPGAPKYAEYIRFSKDEKRTKYPPTDRKDGKEVYYEGKLYEISREIQGHKWDDGVEISKCVAYLD